MLRLLLLPDGLQGGGIFDARRLLLRTEVRECVACDDLTVGGVARRLTGERADICQVALLRVCELASRAAQ